MLSKAFFSIRVSFGSSKGSMVETLIYESPLQEEPETSPPPSKQRESTIPYTLPEEEYVYHIYDHLLTPSYQKGVKNIFLEYCLKQSRLDPKLMAPKAQRTEKLILS